MYIYIYIYMYTNIIYTYIYIYIFIGIYVYIYIYIIGQETSSSTFSTTRCPACFTRRPTYWFYHSIVLFDNNVYYKNNSAYLIYYLEPTISFNCLLSHNQLMTITKVITFQHNKLHKHVKQSCSATNCISTYVQYNAISSLF